MKAWYQAEAEALAARFEETGAVAQLDFTELTRRSQALLAARQSDLDLWLRADPRHRRAFEETRRLWARLEQPVAQVLSEGPAAATFRFRWPRLPSLTWQKAALVACCLVLTAAGLVYHDEVVDRVRSDHMTAVGERAPLRLEDGSRLTLNSDSAVTLDLGPEVRQVRLLRGEAWFEVSPDGNRPFFVETPLGTVQVTGTSFNVRLEEESAVVSLAEGRVELTSGTGKAAGQTLSIAPGQEARLSDAGVSDPRTFDRTAVTAWLRGQMVFYDSPLAEVVAELNRYRTGRIVVADSDLEQLRVSGVFRVDDTDAALSVIADTLPVEVTRLTGYLVLLR